MITSNIKILASVLILALVTSSCLDRDRNEIVRENPVGTQFEVVQEMYGGDERLFYHSDAHDSRFVENLYKFPVGTKFEIIEFKYDVEYCSQGSDISKYICNLKVLTGIKKDQEFRPSRDMIYKYDSENWPITHDFGSDGDTLFLKKLPPNE